MPNGLRVVAAAVSAVMLLTVIRLIVDGQTPARILAEVLLIGGAVYLLTFVVWPRRFARSGQRIEIEQVETHEVDEQT